MYKRPWCCPDPRCSILYQLKGSLTNDLDVPQPGESFLCFGKMPRMVDFRYDGVEHANDLNTCSYTALKGMIRFQENEADWRWIKAAYTSALAALDAEDNDVE